jgi:hypothetical protein
LGIAITDNVVHFLDLKEKKRLRRIAKTKLNNSKKDRLKLKHDKLRLDTAIAQKERNRRDGTYKTGQNMDHVDEDMPDANAQPRRGTANNTCPHCHLKGHKTRNSKKCLFFIGNNKQPVTTAPTPENLAAAALAAAAVQMHREDATRMDAMPLQDDPPSDLLLNLDEFEDCDTWEDDGGLLRFGEI